jgi:hypothetical protein
MLKKILFMSVVFPLWLLSADGAERPQGNAKFIPIAVGGITVIIPAPIEKDSPIGQAKRFVSAYLANNTKIMKSITYQKNIDKLQEVDDKAKEAFRNIFSYEEQVYFHGYKAAVVVKTKVSETVALKFYFSWVVNRWVLDRVI